jgi:enolase
MSKIIDIKAREILDSRGNPTIETKLTLKNGIVAKASVPSGASTGVHEAIELRDKDSKRYGGMGVLRAIHNVDTLIKDALVGKSVRDQEDIDKSMLALDGTDNKSRLGANAILSVSLACARAGALDAGLELFQYLAKLFDWPEPKRLPTPSFNIFNGGKHADTNLDFQEFMILPLIDITFAEKVRMGAEIFHELGVVLKKAGLDTDVGNEGGYAPDIRSSIQAIELIMAACINAGYQPGKDVGLGIDVGSSELYDQETKEYIFTLDHASFSKNTLAGLYREWLRQYPIVSIEDGLGQDDWEGWKEMNRDIGSEIMLIGDDLFVTNIERLRIGLKEKAANAILIKPNQVGTLTETAACVKLAQKHNYKVMASHRSGETCDDFIADLAVAMGADFIKSGSLARGERLAKYNRLMEIEDIIRNKE